MKKRIMVILLGHLIPRYSSCFFLLCCFLTVLMFIKGFPHRFTPAVPVIPHASHMYTCGVGELHVKGYHEDNKIAKVAIALSEATLLRGKSWKKDKNSSFSELLLLKDQIVTPYMIKNPLKVAITIRFEEDFETREFVNLFEEKPIISEKMSKTEKHLMKDLLFNAINQRRVMKGKKTPLFSFSLLLFFLLLIFFIFFLSLNHSSFATLLTFPHSYLTVLSFLWFCNCCLFHFMKVTK
jgi:hypothetical protein